MVAAPASLDTEVPAVTKVSPSAATCTCTVQQVATPAPDVQGGFLQREPGGSSLARRVFSLMDGESRDSNMQELIVDGPGGPSEPVPV